MLTKQIDISFKVTVRSCKTSKFGQDKCFLKNWSGYVKGNTKNFE